MDIPDIVRISTRTPLLKNSVTQGLRDHLTKLPHIIDVRIDQTCEERGLDFSNEILKRNPHLSNWSVSPAPSSWISRMPLAVCGQDMSEQNMTNFINSLLHNVTFFTLYLRRLRYIREK